MKTLKFLVRAFIFLCWWICSFTSEIYLPKLEVQPGAKIKTRPVFLLGAT